MKSFKGIVPDEGKNPDAYPTWVLVRDKATGEILLDEMCEIPFAGLPNTDIKFSNWARTNEDQYDIHYPGFNVNLFTTKGNERNKFNEFINTDWNTGEYPPPNEKWKDYPLYPGTASEHYSPVKN